MNPLSLLPPPPPSTNFFNDPHTTTTTVETSLARRRTRPRLHDPRAPPPPVPLLHLEILSSLFNPSTRREHATRGAFLLLFLRFYFSSVSSFLLFFLPNLDLSSNFPSLSPSRALLSRAKGDKPRHYRVDRHFRHAEDGTSLRVPAASVINPLATLRKYLLLLPLRML